jgi:hypothetical protein
VGVDVIPVESAKERDRFLRLPWRLYKNDAAWIPNLLLLQRETIDPKKNPFFEHGEARFYLARRDGVPVGRISAQIDRLNNEYRHENAGFFGFFEAENDAEVAAALFGAAEGWLREKGTELARGPFNLSIKEECGVLVEGFEHPPMLNMTHSPPYYDALIKGEGYDKVMDLYAYRWDITEQEPPARIMSVVDQVRRVPGLTVRTVELKHMQRDVGIMLDIFNDAWRETWGFVPVTPAEAKKIANDLRLIVEERIGIIAEVNGEPAGMILGLPNLYEAIRDNRGFLNPLNAVRAAWRLKVRKLETGRLFLFGIKKKFRTRELVGLPFLLLYELYLGARKGRYKWGEMSWILENNSRMNALMPYWDAHVYKRYRLYEKKL